ncbi:hypothetical protein HDU97_004029 [Phlyctochytrium planicorne]|nr:hypothetical protein HDU97_004029 [Phlyctochytrium planicorne]
MFPEILNEICNKLPHPLPLIRLSMSCRRLRDFLEDNTLWKKYADKGKIKPKPNAKKFQTWKQVLVKEWGHLCDRCFNFVDKRSMVSKNKDKDGCYAKTTFSKCCKTCYAVVQQEYKEEKERKREIEMQSYYKDCDERRKILADALQERGLELRSDSRVCESFIRGSGKLEEVVTTMIEMNWYFNNTGYSRLRFVPDPDHWSYYSKKPRNKVDAEWGKAVAKAEWCQKRLDQKNFCSPRLDPENEARPPPSLWDGLDQNLSSLIAKYQPGQELQTSNMFYMANKTIQEHLRQAPSTFARAILEFTKQTSRFIDPKHHLEALKKCNYPWRRQDAKHPFHKNVVKALIRLCKDEDWERELIRELVDAVREEDEGMVRFLVEFGIDINSDGVYAAALPYDSNMNRLKLVESFGATPLHPNNLRTALFERGLMYPQALKLFLDAGLSPNSHCHRHDNDVSLLAGACQFRVVQYINRSPLGVAKLLVSRGADIHANDNEALVWATRSECLKVMQYLIDLGAKITVDVMRASIEYGKTLQPFLVLEKNGAEYKKHHVALMTCAVQHGNYNMFRWLLKRVAKLGEDNLGHNLLLVGFQHNQSNMVNHLIKAGAKLNDANDVNRMLAENKTFKKRTNILNAFKKAGFI